MTGTISSLPAHMTTTKSHFAPVLMPGFTNPVLIPTFEMAETTSKMTSAESYPPCGARWSRRRVATATTRVKSTATSMLFETSYSGRCSRIGRPSCRSGVIVRQPAWSLRNHHPSISRPRMILPSLMPPAVLPADPPISISAVRTITVAPYQSRGFAFWNPVQVMPLTVMKSPSRRASTGAREEMVTRSKVTAVHPARMSAKRRIACGSLRSPNVLL